MIPPFIEMKVPGLKSISMKMWFPDLDMYKIYVC